MTRLFSDLEVLLRGTMPPNITVQLDIVNHPLFVSGSEAQLQSALLNLAINARDAMAERGGTLRMVVRVLSGEDGQRFVTIHFRDTGPGIPDDVLPHVFEPFFTTKPLGKGTGLGLAGVYAAVQAHNGTIHIQNAATGGLDVEITLPLMNAVSSDTLLELDGSVGGGPSRTVLVVDDEEPIRLVLSKQLEQLGLRRADS